MSADRPGPRSPQEILDDHKWLYEYLRRFFTVLGVWAVGAVLWRVSALAEALPAWLCFALALAFLGFAIALSCLYLIKTLEILRSLTATLRARRAVLGIVMGVFFLLMFLVLVFVAMVAVIAPFYPDAAGSGV